MRADLQLSQWNFFPSRAKAQEAIKAGLVLVKGAPLAKAAQTIAQKEDVQVTPHDTHYASRAGDKLHKGLAAFSINLDKKVCLDLGQSTGGFTDCCLTHGATKVIGVEVGHGQLRDALRQDPRVVCIEKCNARFLDGEKLGEHTPQGGFTFITGDLSFISLTLILPAISRVMAANGEAVMLVKPQFELGRDALDKCGVVRDSALYETLQPKMAAAAAENGLFLAGWCESPIQGGEGNREFIGLFRKAKPNG